MLEYTMEFKIESFKILAQIAERVGKPTIEVSRSAILD